MSSISLGVLSSGALAGAERSEGGEPQRSGAAAKAGAGSRPVSLPDSEVVAKAKRRNLYRGVQTTHLGRGGDCCCRTWWRRRSASPRRSVLVAVDLLEARASRWNSRGSDSAETWTEVQTQSEGGRIPKLRRQNARLTEDLRKAHIIIDVQKKVAALLWNPVPETDPDPEEKS